MEELLEATYEQLLELRVVIAIAVFVAVADGAAVHAVGRGANAAEQDAFLLRDSRHGEVLDADEDEGGVHGGDVVDEVREDPRHALREVGVDEADAGDAGDAEIGAEAEQPEHRHECEWNPR